MNIQIILPVDTEVKIVVNGAYNRVWLSAFVMGPEHPSCASLSVHFATAVSARALANDILRLTEPMVMTGGDV
jgi:hypothetical protein